jgi:pteridine reductase
MNDLSGSTAIVTGASRRLGKDIGLGLAREGVNVVVHYRNSEKEAMATADRIRSTGAKAWAIQADLGTPRGVEEFVSNCSEIADPVSILINSASIFPEGGVLDAAEEEFLENIRINTLAPLALCRWFANQSGPVNQGAIVNLLDARMVDYDRLHVPYHLSKQALFSLTRMLSIELAPEIRVNGVAPGLVLPPESQGEEYLHKFAHTNPLNTWGSASDITDAVLFLLKASFVTGQIIYVDGGRHMKGRFYGS